jgi:hypothetical protein
MRTTSITAATVVAASLVSASLAASALAQEANGGFAAHANVTVANNSPVPQIVAGTNVPPFELLPHQQAELAMNAPPPPIPGDRRPVRFYYSVGQAPGPQCHGTIDMTVAVHGVSTNADEATNCVAHSLGTGGASCNIAVSAHNARCVGGLAFVAP